MILTTAIILAGFADDTFAQQSQPSATSFGLTGGIGSSTHLSNFRFVSGDIDLDFTPNFTTSYHVGFIIRQKINERYRVQFEPTIARMGARYEEAFELRGFNFETQSETELLYARLPILLQISTVPPHETVYGRHRSRTTFHGIAGVFAGYLIDAQFNGTNSGAPIGIEFSGAFSNSIRDQYKEYDAGLTVGAGFEHGYARRIGLEGRFELSVLDTGDTPDITFEPRNLSLRLVAYILF